MISFNVNTLPQGIPKIDDYKKLLKTDLFLEMESFSNTFLKTHAKALKNYRVVTDPFHQWSRQWEYPFTYFYVQQYLNNKIHTDEIRILDAGSGCTFFPYYLDYKYSNCRIYCCDYNSSLAQMFLQINKKTNSNVEFNAYDLASIDYEDNFFDIVIINGVLEHTHNYQDIIKQFKQTLKPGGLLIVTFDISLDRKAKITIEVAQNLLNALNNEFKNTNTNNFRQSLIDIQEHDILTTEFIENFDKKLLPPWKLSWTSSLRKLLKLRFPKTPFWNLTIFCGVWEKTM